MWSTVYITKYINAQIPWTDELFSSSLCLRSLTFDMLKLYCSSSFSALVSSCFLCSAHRTVTRTSHHRTTKQFKYSRIVRRRNQLLISKYVNNELTFFNCFKCFFLIKVDVTYYYFTTGTWDTSTVHWLRAMQSRFTQIELM